MFLFLVLPEKVMVVVVEKVHIINTGIINKTEASRIGGGVAAAATENYSIISKLAR